MRSEGKVVGPSSVSRDTLGPSSVVSGRAGGLSYLVSESGRVGGPSSVVYDRRVGGPTHSVFNERVSMTKACKHRYYYLCICYYVLVYINPDKIPI